MKDSFDGNVKLDSEFSPAVSICTCDADLLKGPLPRHIKWLSSKNQKSNLWNVTQKMSF